MWSAAVARADASAPNRRDDHAHDTARTSLLRADARRRESSNLGRTTAMKVDCVTFLAGSRTVYAETRLRYGVTTEPREESARSVYSACAPVGVTSADVDWREEAERWRRRAEMLDAALSVISEHVYIVDRDGINLYANLAAARSTGVGRGDIEGRPWREIYSGNPISGPLDVAEAFEEQVRRVFETGRQSSAVYSTSVPYGLRDFLITLIPIFKSDGVTVDYVIDIAAELSDSSDERHGPSLNLPVTERQREIIELVARGHSNPEIAELLFISVRTVETHRRMIGKKLGLKSRADIFRYAHDVGWV